MPIQDISQPSESSLYVKDVIVDEPFQGVEFSIRELQMEETKKVDGSNHLLRP
jgi:hypothetical protein